MRFKPGGSVEFWMNLLNWVFKDKSEKENAFMTKEEKFEEYMKRITEWEKDHNPVTNKSPVFA